MNAIVRPAARRSKGPWRRLLGPFVKPDVFDFWAGHVNRSWTWERPRARLLSREVTAQGVTTLLLRPNRHWNGARPGQHVNLGVEIDGVRYTRSYSPSELRTDGLIAITVKSVDAGRVSRYLSERARPGDVFELGQAFGEFHVPASGGPLLMLAAGSGITPLIAMLRDLAARGMPMPVDLVYWVRTREELCFADELRAMAARHPGFHFRAVLTGQAASAADEHEGRLCEQHVRDWFADVQTRHVLACGPGGFVETARALMARHAASFQAEAFSPPPASVEESGEVDVHLRRSGRRLRIPRGQTLLVALEDAGLKPASGCRMGICNTCACGKSAGSTRHLASGELDHEPSQALKLCVHGAATDLELDL